MSFVEDNKTWILPLLGLGAAAVVWFNVRTFTPATPANPAPAPVAEAPQPPPAPVAAPAPSPGEALWDDLRPVAAVPKELEGRAALEQQALASLRPAAFASPAAPSVQRPGGTEPAPLQRKAALPKAAAPSPAPQPDFLIEGPGGTQAWFDGQGYRTGQPLKGRAFTVQGIHVRPPQVTLQGPSGSASRSTRPAPPPEVP